MFPRGGVLNNTWHDSDPIIVTPSNTYSALDYDRLFTHLGLSAELKKMLTVTRSDPDLLNLAAPMVDTFVTYGTEVPTNFGAKFTSDFKPGVFPGSPAQIFNVSGDGLVDYRSSRRGLEVGLA